MNVKKTVLYSSLALALLSCAHKGTQSERSPSSMGESCSDLVGNMFRTMNTKINNVSEIEAKTQALKIIKKTYPHFSDNQAMKHFDFIKNACL